MNGGQGSIVPRSKSRQTENARTKLHQSRRPLRHSSASNNTGVSSCASEAKRISGSSNSIRSSRRHPCRRIYLGPPRCSRTGPSLLPPMFSYKSYGRSSDPHFDDSISASWQVPNPYMELAREVSLALRRKEDTPSQPPTPTANTKTTPPDSCGGRSLASVDTLIKGEATAAPGPSDEKIFRAQDEHDDEDDEDEGGMPQAVRPSEPHDLARTQMDILKDLHMAKMEEISKIVQPQKLVHHLQNAGYFSHSYHSYARTTMDNFAFKQVIKKPTERLLSLLYTH